jgi:cystathionine beta-lyase
MVLVQPSVHLPFDQRFHVTEADVRARRGIKWRRYGPDVLAAWVADMDFAPAPTVAAALHAAVTAGDVGYPREDRDTGVPDALAARASARWGWTLDPALVRVVGDVMRGIELALLATTRPGDGVVVTTPVYPPFLHVIPGLGRRLVEVPLTPEWRLDADRLRAAVVAGGARAVLLCHPHNPTGRSFDEGELAAVAASAAEHDLIVVSDEIHADLTFAPVRHVPFASLDAGTAQRTVTVTSASKAFNLAGMRCALVVSGDEAVHAALPKGTALAHEAVGSLGVAATLAAWSPEGDEWLAALHEVLAANARHAVERLTAEVPGLHVHVPQATYLLWLDCRGLGLGDDPAHHLLKHGKVALGQGPDFGDPGHGFARLNVATAPELLDRILDRIVAAVAR